MRISAITNHNPSYNAQKSNSANNVTFTGQKKTYIEKLAREAKKLMDNSEDIKVIEESMQRYNRGEISFKKAFFTAYNLVKNYMIKLEQNLTEGTPQLSLTTGVVTVPLKKGNRILKKFTRSDYSYTPIKKESCLITPDGKKIASAVSTEDESQFFIQSADKQYEISGHCNLYEGISYINFKKIPRRGKTTEKRIEFSM